MDVAEPLRVQAIAHAHRQSDVQSFAGLYGQHLAIGLPGVGRSRSVNLLPNVIQVDAVDQRRSQMDAGIQRSWPCSPDLTYADPCKTVRHDRDAPGDEQW